MKRFLLPTVLAVAAAAVLFFFLQPNNSLPEKKRIERSLTASVNYEEKEKEASGKRWEYEWKLLHDPATGLIPRDIHRREAAQLRDILSRQNTEGFRTTINNTYTSAGPSRLGGRSRAVAYDMRNNQIMLAGGVSGGMFRSTDGGNTWNFVHPTAEVRNITCLAQDPRPGFQDTWYAGTGELLGASPEYPNAFIPGNGILKSTDNGLTWTKLAATAGGAITVLDNIFDIVFNVQVAPNGWVYAAVLNYILLSNDGGINWFFVLRDSNLSQSVFNMVTDVIISKDGTRYYASFSGRNSDRDTVGVWTSTNGVNFSRIAGGRFGQADSVAGWSAYNNSISGGSFVGGWGRTVLSLAPSNPAICYVMYENGLKSFNGFSEADLFRVDLSGGTPVWSENRRNFLRADRVSGGTFITRMETQEEYNMMVAVHPTNPDLVVAGGVNLYRSTNGFASAGTFIGGETSTTYTDPGGVSHVDFHAYAFDPTNPNRLVVANDGGLQVTDNITATSVAWSTRNGQFQTVQYYHVAIDPTPGSLAFAGGAQDNSTTYRDARGLLAVVRPDPNDHYVLIGGDGGACGLSPSTSTQQFLYGSAQEGDIYRLNLNRTSPSLTYIKPSGSSDGEFITYFHLDQDNTETLYFAAFNEVWRTNNASTVTQFSGWQRMTGIESTLTGSIFALATSRGTYAGSGSYLFIGTTDGKVYRLADPRNAAPGTLPANISPVTGMTNQSLVRHIAVNPRNPDTVMVVVSNYNVQSAFWTGNATSPTPTWQLVQGNLNTPSFRSCAIIPRSTNVEYYVGTSIGLFSTTAINGPSTLWTLEGPPVMQGALINDLALRASDNTLLVGTHGNGMFYTTVPFTTPVSNLIVNDRSFIQSVYPTVAQGSIRYQPGTATGIRSVNIRVFGMSGQTVLQKTSSYSAGELNISQLPAGNYVLEIISDNRQYKHLQKFVKN